MTCKVYLKKNTLSLFYCRVPEVALFIYYTKYNVHVHYFIRSHLSRLGLYFSFAKLTQNLISLLKVFFISVYRQLGVLEGICFPFSTIKWTVYSLNLLTSTGLDQWPWNYKANWVRNILTFQINMAACTGSPDWSHMQSKTGLLRSLVDLQQQEQRWKGHEKIT